MQVVGALLDSGSSAEYISNLILQVVCGPVYQVASLVEVLEDRERLVEILSYHVCCSCIDP